MPDFPSTVSGEHLLDAHIDLAAPEQIGAGPFGRRTVYIATGGSFEGPKLRGTARPGGGDWLLSFVDYSELDVRATLETHDGALLYITYRGVLKLSDEVTARIGRGEDVSASQYYFRTTPRFETGSESYAWLNSTVCVGYGWFAPGKVAYRIFAIT